MLNKLSVVLKFIQGVRTCILSRHSVKHHSFNLLEQIHCRPLNDCLPTSTHTYRLFWFLKSGRCYVLPRNQREGALYRPYFLGQALCEIYLSLAAFALPCCFSEVRILQNAGQWSSEFPTYFFDKYVNKFLLLLNQGNTRKLTLTHLCHDSIATCELQRLI